MKKSCVHVNMKVETGLRFFVRTYFYVHEAPGLLKTAFLVDFFRPGSLCLQSCLSKKGIKHHKKLFSDRLSAAVELALAGHLGKKVTESLRCEQEHRHRWEQCRKIMD